LNPKEGFREEDRSSLSEQSFFFAEGKGILRKNRQGSSLRSECLRLAKQTEDTTRRSIPSLGTNELNPKEGFREEDRSSLSEQSFFFAEGKGILRKNRQRSSLRSECLRLAKQTEDTTRRSIPSLGTITLQLPV